MASAAKRKKAEIGKMANDLPAGVEPTVVDAEKSEWKFKVPGPEPYYGGRTFDLIDGPEKGNLCPAALGLQDWGIPPLCHASAVGCVTRALPPKDFVGHALVAGRRVSGGTLTDREPEFKKKAG
eukprot:gene40621-34026_t